MLCARSYPAIILMTLKVKKKKKKLSSRVPELQFQFLYQSIGLLIHCHPSLPQFVVTQNCPIPSVTFLPGMSRMEHTCKLLKVPR